jgi:RNA polymerase sigma factor (sigma-70 family)
VSPGEQQYQTGNGEPERGSGTTSFHVRRACALEPSSIAWLFARFSPLLQVQAAYRLRGPLRRLYDPEDLVNEVWIITLPRLEDLRERDGHLGPVLLRFLGTTLLNRANQLIARELGRPRVVEGDKSVGTPALERVPDSLATASTLAEQDEAMRSMRKALGELEVKDREVLVLRLIEEVPNEVVAKMLALTPGAVSKRLKSALEHLRQHMPVSIFGELG